ncbi:hypothetical protein ETB97_005121 [Aspergillus alliaceus]|uniref:Glutamate carboxypeptidase n=1 Tax=Petromyces alliaceus TaxID=209559 RepID=A0A8H5ZZJ7_PETAA|nr:hypothetical protein ETB97_005121 [Aspergillus burnettii]
MEPFRHRPSLKCLAALAVTIPSAVGFQHSQQRHLTTQDYASLGLSPWQRLFDAPKADSIRQCSRYYTNNSHFASQGRRQAEWTQARWEEFGIPQTQLDPHEVEVDFPDGQELTLLDIGNKDKVVLHETSLIEDNIPGPGEDEPPFLPAILGGTPAGNVTAQYVYVNFGLPQDYEDLARVNISVRGKIIITKTVFGSSFLERFNVSVNRVVQMRAAFDMGAVGFIQYTDPQLDGNITEVNGYLPFPDGPARPPSMIERGSAGVGDGHSIPAIPISYADAIPILRALNGHGPVADNLGDRWKGGGLEAYGVQYNVGPSPPNIALNLYTNRKYVKRTVHNTIGKIPGREFPNEVIILGGHRDAWGPGAGDAVSGICALSEIARILGAALRRGWAPRRTIMLASWEGEEIGTVGSRGWLKDNISWLNSSLVGYLNVVVAGAGSKFHALGSPLMTNVLRLASEDVPPLGNNVNYWNGAIGMGSGGDANPFQNNYCFSTLDFGLTNAPGEPVFPYHSLFDSEDWIDRFGDPDREYSIFTTKLWLSLATTLSEPLLLPFLAADYGVSLKEMADELRSKAPSTIDLDFSPLYTALEDFHQGCVAHDAYGQSLVQSSQGLAKKSVLNDIKEVNRKYITLERFFADPDKTLGSRAVNLILPGGSYYIHSLGFPQLRDQIGIGNWSGAEEQMNKIIGQIEKATGFLKPGA